MQVISKLRNERKTTPYGQPLLTWTLYNFKLFFQAFIIVFSKVYKYNAIEFVPQIMIMFCLLSSKYFLVVFFQNPCRLMESLESHDVKLQAGDSDIDSIEKLLVKDSHFHHPSLKHQTKAARHHLGFSAGCQCPRRIHSLIQSGVAT